MQKTKPFTMIDFYESLSTIDLVKVDFDNSNPYQTKNLERWVDHWMPHLLASEKSDMKNFYQALPVDKGLILSDPHRDAVIFIPYETDRDEILFPTAMLINLSRCTTFQSVLHVMIHCRKDDWLLGHTAITHDEFVTLRSNTYQPFRERLQ